MKTDKEKRAKMFNDLAVIRESVDVLYTAANCDAFKKGSFPYILPYCVAEVARSIKCAVLNVDPKKIFIPDLCKIDGEKYE